MTSYPVIEAPLPPELMGKSRESVKLLSINRKSGHVHTSPFGNISDFLESGDLVVFNNSRVVKAALPAYYPGIHRYGEINMGTSTFEGYRLVEPRPRMIGNELPEGSVVELVGTGATLYLQKRDSHFRRYFWAGTDGSQDPMVLAEKYGKYIRYGHIPFDLPDPFYITTAAKVAGSVEFPSAARPFTEGLLKELGNKGVRIAELTLHCNLGSLEPPEFLSGRRLLREEYHIPGETSRLIGEAKENGKRVIAVGTSVVRALESSRSNGTAREGKGSTELFITPGFGFEVVDGIITGMHEGYGSHIGMISAFAGVKNLDIAYRTAAENGFLWHEFGDMAMII